VNRPTAARRRHTALLVVLALSAATARSAGPSDERFDDPMPAHLRGDPPDRIEKLHSCGDYERLRGAITGSDNELDYGVLRSVGARCDATALLRRAKAGAKSALPAGDFLAWRAASLFPGSLWPAFSDEETKRPAAPRATLRTASGNATLVNVQGQFLQVEDRGAGVHLSLIGLGDVDGDGWQDAVVLVEGYAKAGNATTARAAVLTRRPGDATLRELPADALLR
jgi:hypothetical protein